MSMHREAARAHGARPLARVPAPLPRSGASAPSAAAGAACAPRRAAVALFSLTGLAGGALAAPTATTSTAPTTLRSGRPAAGVVALQQALGIPADGIYGPQTRRAVRRFQRGHGLSADGVAGPATLRRSACPRGRAATRVVGARRRPRAPPASSAARPHRPVRVRRRPDRRLGRRAYRGKYQFSRETWRAMGGSGDPAAASEAEQDRRAAKLLRGAGPVGLASLRVRVAGAG